MFNNYIDPYQSYDPNQKLYAACGKYDDPCQEYFQSLNRTRNPVIFTTDLSGMNEVPPNNSNASGKAISMLSGNETSLDFIVQTAGLRNITMAHFHDGKVGVNGPIVKTIQINPVTGKAIGSWTNMDPEPLTPTLVNKLKRGDLYINIHTVQLPDGEIRGQLH